MSGDDSKTPVTPESIEIDAVPLSSLFTLELSGAFLASMQTALLTLSQRMGTEKVRSSMEKFRTGSYQPEDLDEHVLFLLVSLVGSSEKAAAEQGKTSKQRFRPDELLKVLSPSA